MNNDDREWWEFKRQVDERKKKNQEKYQEASKALLKQNLTKRLRTTMIGAIASFEQAFGYLWGHGQDKRLSPDQQELLELWNEVRKEILDKGNDNIRSASDEIDRYDCSWNRFQTNFVIRGQENGK